mgnify:CR=1 FL=1|jgi:hypothetical protein
MHIIIISLIITLFSPVVMAGEKSITIVCSNDVAAGSIVLTNPPKINCDDFSKAQTVIGLGITVGSGLNTERLLSRISQSLPMGKINRSPSLSTAELKAREIESGQQWTCTDNDCPRTDNSKKSKRTFSMKELCDRGALINCEPYYKRGSYENRFSSRTRQKWFDDSSARPWIAITGDETRSRFQ